MTEFNFAHIYPNLLPTKSQIEILDTDDCEQCTKTLEELENIDDDCDRHGITFVKTKDFSVAEAYGVHDYPALVYFEDSIPNVFEGKLIQAKGSMCSNEAFRVLRRTK